MNRKLLAIAALLAVVVFISTALLVAIQGQAAPLDPLAKFRTPDGKLSIPGGAFTKELQQLLFPPPAPKNYTTYAIDRRSVYMTMAIEGTVHDIPQAARAFTYEDSRKAGADLFGRLLEGAYGELRHIWSDLLGFLSAINPVGSARAACGDGASTCTWDNGGGDGLWSTATNWAPNNTVPATGDSVVFDGTSSTAASVDVATPALTAFSINAGYGSTITVSINQTQTWGAVAFGAATTGTLAVGNFNVTMGSMTLVAGGILTAGSGTIGVAGNWDSSVGTWTRGISRVKFTTNAQVKSTTANTFYKLAFDTASVTITVVSNIAVFQIDATVADATLSLDTTVLGAPIALTFDDTASAGFTGSAGGRQRDELKIVGTVANGVTIQSAAAPPTNRWNQSGTTWGVNTGGWAYATLIDFSDNGFDPIPSAAAVAGWRTLNNVTFKSNTVTEHVAFGDQIRATTLVYDKILYGSVGRGASNICSFISNNSVLNGGSFTPTASAQASTIGFQTYLGSANDYRFVFGNGVPTTTALSCIQAGDRPAATDNVTWGFGISAEKGTVDVAQTWTTVSIGSGTTLTLSGGVALTISGGGITVGAGKTLDGGSSTITVNGNWNSNGGTFTAGTGTVRFSTAATWTTSSFQTFYNVIIDVSLTVSIGTNVLVTAVLTVNGTLSLTAAIIVRLTNTVASTDPFVMGGSGTVTSSAAGSLQLSLAACGAGNLVNVPNATYNTGLTLRILFSAVLASPGCEFRLAGNLTVGALEIVPSAATAHFYLNTQTFNVTINGTVNTILATPSPNFGIRSTSGTWSAGLNNTNPGFYWQMGAIAITPTGAWTNASTSSALWQGGTSSMTFDSSSGTNRTMTFAGTALGVAEFNNAVFNVTSATSSTYTMATRDLWVGGSLTISDSTNTTTLSTSGSNLAITAGSVTVGAGGILTANASTITVSGNWDSSAGTFTFGTSTIVFAANGNLTTATSSGAGVMYNLTVNALVTVTVTTNNTGLSNILTVNGTLNLNARTMYGRNTTAAASPIVMGASGAITGSGNYYFLTDSVAGAVNVPAFANSSVVTLTFASLQPGNSYVFTGNTDIGAGALVLANYGQAFTVNTGTYNFTAGVLSDQSGGGAASTVIGLVATSGTWTTYAPVWVQANSAAMYMSLGAVNWTIATIASGYAFNVGVSTSVNWSAGTSTITVTVAGVWKMGTTTTFNTLTIRGVGSSVIYAPNGLVVNGALTFGNGVALGTFDTGNGSGSNCNGCSVAAGNFTLTTNYTFTANSSAITVSGNWDSSAGTFTKGTSTVTMSGAGKTIAVNGAAGFYDLVISGTISDSGNVSASDALVVSVGAVLTVGTTTFTSSSTSNINGSLTVSTGTASLSGLVEASTGAISVTGAGVLTVPTGGTINGSITISGAATVSFVGPSFGASAFVDNSAASSWTVTGQWANTSTSASWSWIAGTIAFTSASSTTMRWGALAGQNEFFNVTFTSSSAGAVVFSPTSNSSSLRMGGALTITDGGSTTTYTTIDGSAASHDIITASMTVAVGGILIANASTITISGNWNSSAGTFTYGTSTVVLATNGSVWTVTGSLVVNNFYNLTANDTVTITLVNSIAVSNTFTVLGVGAGGITNAGQTVFLNSASATPLVVGVSTKSLDLASLYFNMSVNYSIPTANYNATYIILENTSLATITATANGSLTTTGWFLVGEFPGAGADVVILAMGGDALTSTSSGGIEIGNGAVTFTTGAMSTPWVLIDYAVSYMQLGSGSHVVSGAWTNNSTSVSWDAGSGTVTFTSAVGGVMTFANLGADEFNDLTFISSGAGAQTFTMAVNGIRYGGSLTIQDAVGTTELVTAGFSVSNFSSGSLVVGNGGILTATSSSVFAGSVLMTGGASGVITITTGLWQIGSVGPPAVWDTSGAGSTFTPGTGTVTIANGGSATVAINGTQGFTNLTIPAGGPVTALTAINVSTTLTLAGTFVITGADLSVGALTSVGVSGDVLVSAGGTFTMSGAVAFTVPGNWNSTAGTFTKATSTVTMSGAAKTVAINVAAGFYGLTVSGTVTQTTVLDVSNALATSGAGTLTTGGLNITGGATLSLAGTGGLIATTSFATFGAAAVGSGTTLSFTSGSVLFTSLTAASAGSFVMDGFTSTNFTMTTSAGNITLTDWFAASLLIPFNVSWQFNPSVAGAAVTIIYGGFPTGAGLTLALFRDGTQISKQLTDGLGTVTFAVTGGWSSHLMKIGDPAPAPGPGPSPGGEQPGILVTQVSGLTYKFTIDANGLTIIQVDWNFGDGATDTGLIVYHTYAAAGTYIVKAVVTTQTQTLTVSRSIVITTISIVGYIVAILTIILLLGSLLVRDESLKYWLAVSSVVVLAFQLSRFFMFGELAFGREFMSALLLGRSALCLALSFLPTKVKERGRGAWMLLGVIAIALWYYTAYM